MVPRSVGSQRGEHPGLRLVLRLSTRFGGTAEHVEAAVALWPAEDLVSAEVLNPPPALDLEFSPHGPSHVTVDGVSRSSGPGDHDFLYLPLLCFPTEGLVALLTAQSGFGRLALADAAAVDPQWAVLPGTRVDVIELTLDPSGRWISHAVAVDQAGDEILIADLQARRGPEGGMT